MRVETRIDQHLLPADVAVTSVVASEAMSSPFEVRVELACGDAELDLEELLGATAVIGFEPVEVAAPPRYFHGVIDVVEHDDEMARTATRYAITLRPHVHALRYRRRTRIFQEKSVVEIVREIFDDAGIPADSVRWETTGDYPTRTYCTQWKESELDFVSRLLEDEGIFYFFEHDELGHVLVFGDDPNVHRLIEGEPFLPVIPRTAPEVEGLWEPVFETRMVHDGVKTRDFSFETPGQALEALRGDGTSRLDYHYPGAYRSGAEGQRLAGIRMEERWRDERTFRASATSTRLAPGRKLEVEGAVPESMNREYLLTRVRHEYSAARSPLGEVGTDGTYGAELDAIPSEVPYRPSRVTPRPRAHGLESAVVTGPAGEEIHVDEYGRIKVHFYWDREQAVDDKASCWLRVQQVNTHGAMILPRIGWEVSVAFENGDPDRPFAIHKAYNQETMPPYAQPANKTQSALQSSTSPGGGSVNEIRLQDGNGGMEWSMHASKDLNVVVAHDENETVGIDVSETVGATMTNAVGANEVGSIGANQSLSVTANSDQQTSANLTVSVGANDDWGMSSNFEFTTGGDRSETIGGLMNVLSNRASLTVNGSFTRTVGAVQAIASATAISETVAGSKTETVSAAKAIITPKDHAESVGGSKTLTSGAMTIKAGEDVQVSAKGAIAVTSAAKIAIECGEDAMFTGSQVRITTGKAKLQGGGGTLDMAASLTIDAKKFGGKGGPMLKLKGNIDYK